MNAKQLKDSILQLAFEGKLVSQSNQDEPAYKLLKKIKEDKETKVLDGIYKKENSQNDISESELPFVIPSSWTWARLGDIAYQINDGTHSTPRYIEKGVPFISVKNMSNGELSFQDTKFISEEEHSELSKRCKPEKGDLLLSKVGTTGVPAIVNTDREFSLFVSVALIKFNQNLISNKYLYYLFQSPYLFKQSKDGTRGVGNKNLVLKVIKNFIIPIPPFNEQIRIVKAIEKFKLKVDEYDLIFNKLENISNTLTQKIDKSLLMYSLQGKLVPQNPEIKSVQNLINEINTEKTKLIEQAIIKKEKSLSPIKEEEIPFEIPLSWEWLRLGDMAYITSGSTPLKSNNEYYQDGDIPWCTSTVTGLDKVTTPTNFITSKAVNECSLRKYPSGTLIMAMYGQGKTRGQVTEIDFDFTINQACAAIELYSKNATNKDYIKLCLKFTYNSIREKSSGGAQPNLNLLKVKSILIPLPPIDEQTKIVEMYKKISSIVKRLEK